MEENIKRGTNVEIITQKNEKIFGVVDEIGVRREDKNLLVVLKTGEIGRVSRVIGKRVKTEVEYLITQGESQKLEFKSEALWSSLIKSQEIHESKSYELKTFKQKASKVIIARSIAAFMNSEGGTLVIGVWENKENSTYEIRGIEKDLEKLKEVEKDNSVDGYKRMIIDEIIRPYFPSKIYNSLNAFLSIHFEEFEGKIVCLIKINRSDVMAFLNLEGRKIFMIRTESQTRQIVDEELVDYCMERFR